MIQTPIGSIFGKLKLTFLVFVSIIGMNEVVGGNNVFHSTKRLEYYDKGFIGRVKNILPQLNYPLGIIYKGNGLEDNFAEDFPQVNATFLKLFGRNYDVFNIVADSLKRDYFNQANQKINVSISRNALNIWIRNQERIMKTKKKLGGKDFYQAFPFSFCVSKMPKDSLPDYIKADVVNIIRDNKAKIYFYRLKRKGLNQNY